MKAAIFHPPSNPPSTQRLVDYIKDLAGVDVEVITWPKDPTWMKYPTLQNEAFRHTCAKMKEPFVWLEQDSIPLCADWLDQLQARWEKKAEKTLGIISTDYQSPFDMCGGIGIYDPRVRGLIPQGLLQEGFDGWLTRMKGAFLERTGLLQHSYAFYKKNNDIESRHEFPRDNWILRETSVIFHSDKNQTLIK
jgi:hypothetical protein